WGKGRGRELDLELDLRHGDALGRGRRRGRYGSGRSGRRALRRRGSRGRRRRPLGRRGRRRRRRSGRGMGLTRLSAEEEDGEHHPDEKGYRERQEGRQAALSRVVRPQRREQKGRDQREDYERQADQPEPHLVPRRKRRDQHAAEITASGKSTRRSLAAPAVPFGQIEGLRDR